MSWGDNKQSRFAVSNLGVAFNIYEDSSTRLTSMTLALGYNRIADFNYRYGFSSASDASMAPYRSIADAFSLMMGQSGLLPEGNNFLPLDYRDAYYWGGILAYNGELLDVGEDKLGKYYTSADRIGANAGIGHTVQMQSRGSIGEYDVALGMNFGSKLYVGFTIGIQSVSWKQQMGYYEDYLYGGATPVYADGTPLARPAEWMDYGQSVKLSGAGINFKAGVVYRPVEALRLGMAIHTPTYYVLDRSYQASMATNFNPVGEMTSSLDDFGENTWDFASPTRLMFGASYAFGRYAVVSVDYERDWYNGIRARNIPAGFDLGKDDYRQEFKDNYKGSNIVRVGAEIKPLPMLALRAGYGVAGGALREDKSLYLNGPQTYKTTCIAAGAGVALGSMTIDLAYQHLTNKQSEYMLFYAMDSEGVFDTASPTYRTDLRRNYFTLTIGYRF
jgi:hypothetical protein